jgi:hypothetical protein
MQNRRTKKMNSFDQYLKEPFSLHTYNEFGLSSIKGALSMNNNLVVLVWCVVLGRIMWRVVLGLLKHRCVFSSHRPIE